MVKLSTICGFTEGVSVDVLYLEINDVLEYNQKYDKAKFISSQCEKYNLW